VVVIRPDRQATEDRISVSGATVATIFSDTEIKPELFRDCADLIELVARVVHANHFLQRHDVSVDLLQHLGNPHGTHAAIETTALMYVVSCNS
jgi:hypothetical protein